LAHVFVPPVPTRPMANIYFWLKQVRKTREEEELLRERFEKYEPSYVEALEELEDIGGDEASDELAEWMLGYARKKKELPRPSRVRAEAPRYVRGKVSKYINE